MTVECSIIIPTFNTAALTVRCIERIQMYPPARPYEILVVDNASRDDTPARVLAAYPQVKVLRQAANLGFSKACNAGAREARGRYLIFLNSDTEALDQTFEPLLRWMDAHPGTGIGGPELVSADNTLLQMSWGWTPLMAGELIQQYFAPYTVRASKLRQRLIRLLQRKSRSVPSICGACLLIRREVFQHIKGFDEDFELYFEDSDLCWRCIQSGWRIDFIPDSKIIHHLGQSTRGAWSMTSLIYQQSHIKYYRKHAPGWAIYLLKGYLLLKWLRLQVISHLDKKDGDRGIQYCQWYLRIIRESEKIALRDEILS